MLKTTRKAKRSGSIFEALADKSKKPDAAGFQPFDPKLLRAIGFKTFD